MSDTLKHDNYRSLIVDAISNKHFPLDEVCRLSTKVHVQYDELLLADDFLRNLESNYNKDYPAKYPGCIDQSLHYMQIISSSVKTCAELMKTLSPISNIRKEKYEKMGVPFPSKYMRSYLSNSGTRQYTLPFANMFVPEVERLVDGIDKLFCLFMDDLELLMHLRQEEKIIKTLGTKSEDLYNQFFKEVEEEFDSMGEFLTLNKFDAKNNVIMLTRLKYPNFQEFVKDMLHQFTHSQLRKVFYAILAGLCKPLQSSNEELLKDISHLENPDYKIGRDSYENEITDTIIAEFNNYVPPLKRGTVSKIQGETLAFFSLALGVQPGLNALALHKYFIRKYEGGLKVCQYNTFIGKLSYIYIHVDYHNDITYKKIVNRIEELKKNTNTNGKILDISNKNRISS